MCTVLLPPGVNPIAVKCIISYISYHHIIVYHISYHIYHTISYHISIFPRYNSRSGLRVTDLCWLSAVFYLDFFGAFANLQKATISFVMSVCPSVSPHGTTRFPLDGISWNFIQENFSKIRRESSGSIQIGQEWRVLYMKVNILFYISLSYS
jgi:hypothetical protein